MLAAAPVRAQNFQGLGFLPGFDYSEAAGVSADGKTVAGNLRPIGLESTGNSEAFGWTASTGMVALGIPTGRDTSRAMGVSGDGTTFVGYGQLLNSGTGARAFKWTSTTGFVDLGDLPGGHSNNFATATNADGSVIVGAAAAGCCTQAIRWTASTGMVNLGVLPGATGGVANGVSGDGSVVVGYSSTNEAFRWTAATGATGLGFLPGSNNSLATSVSANGSVVVGSSRNALGYDQAFRWTAATGMSAIGSLPGAVFSQANAVNADGSVIVGTSGNVNFNFQAYRWTQATGIQSIPAILSAAGYGPANWSLQTAQGVSADGTVIVGNGIDPNGKNEAWIAHIPINAFALLDLNGVDHSLGSLVWGGVVTNSGVGTATLTAGSDNTTSTFIGTIQDGLGATSFVKTGTGTLTLTGASTYTGATTINGGTLEVEGSIASSSLTTVNGGSALTGAGTVGSALINSGGLFAPGNGLPGSSMMVAGDLAFQSGALYLVQINPSTASFADVAGTATLANATVYAVFSSGTTVFKRYTILTAGALAGTFDPATVNTNLPSGFKTTLSYDATHAYLNLTLAFVASPGSRLNANQQNVTDAIGNSFNTNGSVPLTWGGLTPSRLIQLSGEGATPVLQTTFGALNQFIGVMTDPFAAGRNDPIGVGGNPSAYADENLPYAAKRKPNDALAGIYTKAPAGPSYEQRWSVWAAGYGGSQRTDGNAVTGSNDTRSSIYGTAVGADYRFSPGAIAGFALAGGGTNFSVNGLGSGRSDLFQAGAFVRHNVGAAYFVGALAYGWQDVTTDRTVTVAGVDQLRARFNANAWSGRVEGGYRFIAQGFGWTPYAAGQFTTFDLPNYAEQAVVGSNTFALAYDATSVTDARSELGLRTDKSLAAADGLVTLRGRAAWAHDFNPNRPLAATFQTLPGASFVVNGARQASDSVLVTAAIEKKWLNGWSAAATFEGEFSNLTESYAGKGVVRYAW
nr:autotransporter domain-containing protein [Bradyrhizobium campsiandrae]